VSCLTMNELTGLGQVVLPWHGRYWKAVRAAPGYARMGVQRMTRLPTGRVIRERWAERRSARTREQHQRELAQRHHRAAMQAQRAAMRRYQPRGPARVRGPLARAWRGF
jgi:hypothetical protein